MAHAQKRSNGVHRCDHVRKYQCCNGASSSLLGERRLPTWTDRVSVTAQHRARSTKNGWHLSLPPDRELVDSVPNLTTSAFSRETAAED
jgi:hypothetical protein